MKLGFFTDAHYCGAETLCKTRRPVLSLEKIREAMDAFQGEGVDACFCLGDMTDHAPNETREQTAAFFEQALALIRSYEIPFYFVPGNHDYLAMTAQELYEALRQEPLPCTVTLGDYMFVLLDANYRSNGKRFDEAGVEWTDSNLPADQLDFLKTALQSTTKKCVVLIHENLDPTVEAHHIVKNADEIRTVIRESGKVAAVLQGHYHPGKVSVTDGIPYITFPAMCEGTQNSYRILNMDYLQKEFDL